MTSQEDFYKQHTEKKLKAVEAYLETYLQVMSNQQFETIYIDAFAGSGTLPTGQGGELFKGIEDAKAIVEGSALRALKLQRKFSRYIFIEKDAKKLAEFESLVLEQPGLPQDIEFRRGDANTEILDICPSLNKPKVRSVVFLDPFGSQVGWSTLTALAATEHVDLWYLFPAGLSVNRQISNSDAKMTDEQERSLDRLFGPNDWRNRFIRKEKQSDLFGDIEKLSKSATIDDITRFKIECLGNIFKGGVLDKWLPLGRDGAHWYSLIFAMANPGKQAKKIGHNIARHIMTKS